MKISLDVLFTLCYRIIMNLNEFARIVSGIEGQEENQSIAQIKETIKAFFITTITHMEDEEAIEWFILNRKRYRTKFYKFLGGEVYKTVGTPRGLKDIG